MQLTPRTYKFGGPHYLQCRSVTALRVVFSSPFPPSLPSLPPPPPLSPSPPPLPYPAPFSPPFSHRCPSPPSPFSPLTYSPPLRQTQGSSRMIRLVCADFEADDEAMPNVHGRRMLRARQQRNWRLRTVDLQGLVLRWA